jgi:hypothetical protein
MFHPAIPRDIPIEFGLPELDSGFRRISITAADMSVPKTAMHEDDLSARCKYYVWFPRQIVAVQSVSVSPSVQEPAHSNFDARILTLDRPHIPGADFG